MQKKHQITEQSRMEGTGGGLKASILLRARLSVRSDQGAQVFTQPGLENLPGWSLQTSLDTPIAWLSQQGDRSCPTATSVIPAGLGLTLLFSSGVLSRPLWPQTRSAAVPGAGSQQRAGNEPNTFDISLACTIHSGGANCSAKPLKI